MQYEYKRLTEDTIVNQSWSVANICGINWLASPEGGGWEMVAVWNQWFYFKRPRVE
jgi:hypothetical protein